jgi:hypothetical protein
MNIEVGQPSAAATVVGTEADPTSQFDILDFRSRLSRDSIFDIQKTCLFNS